MSGVPLNKEEMAQFLEGTTELVAFVNHLSRLEELFTNGLQSFSVEQITSFLKLLSNVMASIEAVEIQIDELESRVKSLESLLDSS